MERRSRKLYYSKGDVPIPKTTAWRLGKDSEVASSPNRKRRKIYNRSATCPVPSSTLWRWKGDEQQKSNEDAWSEDEGCIKDGGGVEGTSDNTSSNSDIGSGGEEDSVDASGEDCIGNRDGSDSEDTTGIDDYEDDNGDDVLSCADESSNDNASESDDEFGSEDDYSCDEESDEESEQGIRDRGDDSLLYSGAPISLEESAYATYLYAIRNKLSYEATSQLLELMRIHLPSPNLFPQSLRALKKHLGVMKNLEITHFCSTCRHELPQLQKHCSSCTDSSLSYYVLLPFQDRLADIFADKWLQLQYPFKRKVISDTLQDIQDGKLYQDLLKSGEFLSVPENTGLILCSDGVQLFKSSNQSFWPILLAVTSLPPGIRMNAENLILAGVWQGSGKPPMEIIISKVLQKIDHLQTNGIPVRSEHFSGVKMVRAKLLMGVFDLPARASATNFKQFNGNYSCLYCFDKGVHVSNRQLFLPGEGHNPRSKETIDRHAKKAETTGKVIFGIKGKSILSSYIDIVGAVPGDYMHAVLEGVARRLLSTCLDSKNHTKRFYLGRATKDIDKKLKKIKPPQEFRRSPRSVSSMKHWKASEFRAWLLYYCLPVLSGILPSDYIYHLSLLVSAMHILLGDAIQSADIDKAQEFLVLFYRLVPELYGEGVCTANMHLLIHLPQFVRDWGPLWGYSCFGYESMNGHLRKSCHGTGNVLPQLVHLVQMRQMLPLRGKKIASSCNSNTAAFIFSLAGLNDAAGTLDIKSHITHKKIEGALLDALKSAGYVSSSTSYISLPACNSVRYNSVIYSIAPTMQKRDGSVCAYHHCSQLKFGSIVQFCFCDGSLIALIHTYQHCTTGILDHIRPLSNNELSLDVCSNISHYIYCVKKLSSTDGIVAVPITSIFVKCIRIPTEGTHFDYIVTIPNMFEHH